MTKGKEDLLAILSDKPTKVDVLNFQDYSNLLVDVLLNSETPSTIGIFGDWGSGKTSLMLMIDEILKKKKIKTIWFNAWKYDKEEALWRSLILSILRDLSVGKKNVDEITLKMYAAVSTEKLGQLEVDWLEIGKSVLKGAAFFAAPFLLIPQFASLFTNASFFDKFAESFTRRKIQQSQERTSSIEQFEELYNKLIAQNIKDGDRIVIFIDDLDRCLPVRSLEVFEALKSFLDADNCVYVVACDTRLINQGLLEKYSERSTIDIDEYLGKIIQFSFKIPPIRIEDAERYVRNLGWMIGSDQISQLIATTIDRNPRKLKRFLTDLRIKTQLVKSRQLELTFEVLVKMSCISYTWRDFWSATINDVSVFERAQKISLLPSENERSQDEIEFGKLFHIDQRLNSFLHLSPKVSPADLHQFIFLAAATSTNFPETQGSEGPGKPSDRKRIYKRTIGDRADINPDEAILTKDVELTIDAIRKGTSLILVTGKVGSGKTTMLYIIDQLIANDFVAVYINLPMVLNFVPSSASWFYETARLLKQRMEEKGFSIKVYLNENQFTINKFEFFLDSILSEIKGKRLIIMFDEFGQTIAGLDADSRQDLAQNIIQMLKSKRLTVILSSQISIRSVSESMWSILSKVENVNVELGAIYSPNLIPLYEQIISIPNENFTMSDAYGLLYLLENELRYLITEQFNSHDWWQKGIDPTLFARALDRSVEKEISNEEKLSLLNLGDLFQLIQTNSNWKGIFENIFQNKRIIDDNRNEILRARNSIAHSRDLLPNEMQSFIASAKDIVRIVHENNFG